MAVQDILILSFISLTLLYVCFQFTVKLLIWLLHKKCNIKLKVGGCGIMCLRDIQLQLKNGLTLELETVAISSCLLNSNLKSLLVICLNDVRLQSDIEWLKSRSVSKRKEPTNEISSFSKLKYISLLKFVSIRVLNASIMQLGKSDEEFLLHTSFQEFDLFFVRKSPGIQVNMIMSSSIIKVFKHLPTDLDHPRESCICHFASNLGLTLHISPATRNPIQSVCVNVTQPELMLYEGFSITKFKNYVSNELQGRKSSIDEPKIAADSGDKALKMLENIPEISDILVDSFSIKLMMEGGHKTFTFGVKSIAFHLQVEQCDAEPPAVQSHFHVDEVCAASDHVQIGQLLRFAFEFKMSGQEVDMKFQLSLLHVSYQNEVFLYLHDAFPQSRTNVKLKPEASVNRNKITNVLDGYKVSCVAKVDDVCILFKFPECEAFSFRLVNGRANVDHFIGCDNKLSSNFTANGGSSCEFLLETFYIKIGEDSFAEHGTLKRCHFWNIPVSVGMVLLKAKRSHPEMCIQCMTDCFQIQWDSIVSHLIERFLIFIMSSFPKNSNGSKIPMASKESSLAENSRKIYTIELSFRGLNIFALNELKTGIAVRSDLLNFTSSQKSVKMLLEGFKMSPLIFPSQLFPCTKSSEIKNYDAHISDASLTYSLKEKEATLQMSEDVYLLWNTSLHMTIFTIIEETIGFNRNVLNICNPVASAETKESSQNVNLKAAASNKRSRLSTFLMQAQGNINIGMILSRAHKMVFSSSEVTVSYNEQLKSASSGYLLVLFDDHEVFKFKEVVISLMQESEQQQHCRQGFDSLEKMNNRLLNIHFEEVRFIFPYKYNFAEAFSEQFISIQKWLKKLHKKSKTPFTLDSKLLPDLLVTAKEWSIELEDDPFEVKLRDNFELLEDEYHESLKRKRMLDEKIENLRRTNLLLPGEKINLLYSKLTKKNAEIYIQRSRQLYQREAMRTSLCTWTFEDVEILAIADTSYHGTERVVSKMRQLDVESPYPDEGLEFTTLWCRKMRCSSTSWVCKMRDFPQPMLHIREMHIWGFLIGAEQEASQRAKRISLVEINEPWSDAEVERSMPSMKFYHDLTFDMEEMSMAYGPSWEPVMAQIGQAMEQVSRPSLDPSPPLPWWDKMRLLYHGRLTLSVQHLALLLRASLDPYNTTEQMEISWSEVIIEWTNGKILTKGDLEIYVHTASKYDDCRVLHIPNLKLSINLEWLCLGNPYDHHNIMPCAPDKVPEYSINQEHDSYRAFRSQNLNVSYAFETKNINSETDDIPIMLLYSSTLRWIENLKMILSGVARLTKRGKLFKNTKPRKPQLSRHYHILRVSLNLHKFKIFYWMSFAKQRGLEVVGGRLSLSSEHTQTLVPMLDGLKHRPRSNWNIGYLNCELCDSEIWLYNCVDDSSESGSKSFQTPVERSYFLSVNRVSYGREEIVKDVISEEDKVDTPTHRLVVHGMKGAWTRHNRLVVFSLLDSYQKTVLLKRNLTAEALRCFKVDTQSTPQKLRTQTCTSQNSHSAGPSPASTLQSSHAVSMLQKLVAESEANSMVFIEEIESGKREQQLHGVAACQTDDVLRKKWLIELVNSQVMLRGCETSGYVIVSAAKAQILQREHQPVWKDRSLVSKTTWVGSFECMQYYATVDAGAPNQSADDIMWLSIDNIEERESMVISNLPDLVGSGHSVGGVVSSTVGATSDPMTAPIQLQRIVSRCGCQFFYASYGENIDPSTLDEVPPLPDDMDLWEQEVAVDSFTLTHHDLDICTNSLQYAMILDLVNNLLLYVEPQKKEATKKLQYMRFQLQLCSMEDQKGPILHLQEKVRSLVSNLRRLEKEAYVVHKLHLEAPGREDYIQDLQMLEKTLYEHKEQLNSMNEELTMMISCYKETQIIASRSRQRASSQEKGVSLTRHSEVCFKHAQWRLTEADGQLGIADLVLSNFLYSKVTKTDDSVEHLLEVGYVKVTNLLPNQVYKNVLKPTDTKKIPLDHQCLLRIYCRERAPVGGISIKEHLEVNIIPITIELTDAFYKAMLRFFFPGRDAEKHDDHSEDEEPVATTNKKTKQKRSSTFYGERNDIEKMKERADKNHTFFSIKIPEVALRVSYKGKKEKNIEDVHDLSLVLTTIEYHNKTWTWLDLLMALKNDAKRILLAQAIKQKLLKSRNAPERDNEPQEEEKARILLGPQDLGSSERTLKRGFLSRMRKDH